MTVATIESSYARYLNVAVLPADYGVAYSIIHDRANGNAVYSGCVVGQYYSDAGGGLSYFDVYRAGANFNLGSISGVVSAVDISLYGLVDSSDTDFAITIISGADLGDTYVVADYGDLLDDVTSYGSMDTSSWALESYNTISLNTTGIATVQAALGSALRFGFRSSRDISSTTPKLNGASEYSESVGWYDNTTTNKKPKLTITYTPAFIPRVFII